MSSEDAGVVDDDQAGNKRSQPMQGDRRRRWTPQCRYGNDCHALRRGTGCDFHHTAREVFEASRADGRRKDSTQWQTLDEHEISDDDLEDGEANVSYVGVVRSFTIEPNPPEEASSAVSRTVHSVYAVQAVTSPNDASEQVANGEGNRRGRSSHFAGANESTVERRGEVFFGIHARTVRRDSGSQRNAQKCPERRDERRVEPRSFRRSVG